MNLFFKTVCLPFWLTFWNFLVIRGASRTATTSKMELFVIIVNGWKSLTIITNCVILAGAAVLDPPLVIVYTLYTCILS